MKTVFFFENITKISSENSHVFDIFLRVDFNRSGTQLQLKLTWFLQVLSYTIMHLISRK